MYKRFLAWALDHIDDLPKLFDLFNSFRNSTGAERAEVFGQLMTFLWTILDDFPEVIAFNEQQEKEASAVISALGIDQESMSALFDLITTLLPVFLRLLR